MSRPSAAAWCVPLSTGRLRLTPTDPADADDFADAFHSPELYRHIGGKPRSVARWRRNLRLWDARTSEDGSEIWLNWSARLTANNVLVAWLQATVVGDRASIAYVVSADWQRQGFAVEGAGAVRDHLAAAGLSIEASIAPANQGSRRVAERLGLRATGTFDADGEEYFR